MPPHRPPTIAIIIGAMKSGTTSLFRYLEPHPAIAPSRIKEPAFFAVDGMWSRGLDWYFDLWNFDPAVHRVALEGSTDYAKRPFFPYVPEKIATVRGVRFKFIYLMRHPLRRIESQARHAARTKSELGYLFEPNRSFSLDNGLSERALAISSYAYQIDAFLEHFDPGDLLLLTAEELKRDPAETCRRVCRFLEIDEGWLDDWSASTRHNTAEENIVPHPVVALSSRIGPLRRLIAATVPPERKKKLRRIGAQEVPGRFRLTADEERTILALLAPDLRRLQSRYGIDVLERWGIDLETCGTIPVDAPGPFVPGRVRDDSYREAEPAARQSGPR